MFINFVIYIYLVIYPIYKLLISLIISYCYVYLGWVVTHMISANKPYYYHHNHINNKCFYGLSVEMSVTYMVRLSTYIGQ